MAVEASERAPEALPGKKGKVLIAKLGLDGHDVGAKAIVYHLRDAGFEIVYLGVRQRPGHLARAAVDEDVDLVGISMLSGAHLMLVPQVMSLLREEGADVPVIIGGTIPVEDVDELRRMGVRAVLTPGTSLKAIADTVAELIAERA